MHPPTAKMFLKAETLDDLLRLSHQAIKNDGFVETSTRGRYLTLPGVLLELTNPRARLSRTETRGKIVSCIGELVWILSGSDALHAISPYISQYVDESEDGETIHGAYGPRIFSRIGQHQFERTLAILRQKPSSRRAVIQILERRDLAENRREIPCTLQLQFRIIENRLNLLVSMRSNDAFLGLPHDVFVFTVLQEIMAHHLSIEIGTYKHFAADFHLYEKHLTKVDQFLREGWTSTLSPMPTMPSDRLEESIALLLQAEDHIRTKKAIPPLVDSLHQYWQNLVGFIALHFARIARDRALRENAKKLITEPAYQIYVHDRELNE